MMEWISIKDRMPEEDTKVLCYYYDQYMDVMEYWYDEEGKHTFFCNDVGLIEEVTHWMPLPLPPVSISQECSQLG